MEDTRWIYWESRTRRFYWYGKDGEIYSAQSTTNDRRGTIIQDTVVKVYDILPKVFPQTATVCG